MDGLQKAAEAEPPRQNGTPSQPKAAAPTTQPQQSQVRFLRPSDLFGQSEDAPEASVGSEAPPLHHTHEELYEDQVRLERKSEAARHMEVQRPTSRNLFRLSRMGAADELRPHLEQLGKDHLAVRERDYNGRTMLLTACREGHLATGPCFLSLAASPTRQTTTAGRHSTLPAAGHQPSTRTSSARRTLLTGQS